jgi:hypothetical protein
VVYSRSGKIPGGISGDSRLGRKVDGEIYVLKAKLGRSRQHPAASFEQIPADSVASNVRKPLLRVVFGGKTVGYPWFLRVFEPVQGQLRKDSQSRCEFGE